MKSNSEANNNSNNLYTEIVSNTGNTRAFPKCFSHSSCSTACTKRQMIYHQRDCFKLPALGTNMCFPLVPSERAALPWGCGWITACALGKHPFSQVWRQGWPQKCSLCRDFWNPRPVVILPLEGGREWRWDNWLGYKLGDMPVKPVNVLLFKTQLKLDSSCIYGYVLWLFAGITQRHRHLWVNPSFYSSFFA